VIHANNDGTRQNANGVSLLALSHNSFWGQKMIAKDFPLNFKGHEINLWENILIVTDFGITRNYGGIRSSLRVDTYVNPYKIWCL